MMGKTAVIGTGIACFLVLSATLGLTADKASLALNWVITGEHAPYFVAQEKGYYKKEGIEVSISPGAGSGDTVRRVQLGEAMFGHADSSAVIVARARGVNSKLLSMLIGKSPHVVVSLKKAGIQRPTDLKGKRIGGSVADVTRIVFPAFAKINGLNPEDVIWVSTTPAAKSATLLAGEVDAISTFTLDQIPLEAMAEKMGLEIASMKFGDWGLDLYSVGLLTTDKLISERRDLVARFVRASMEGFAAALENPQAGVDLIIRTAPGRSPDITLKQLMLANELLLTDEAYKEGLGTISRAKMSVMIDVLTEYMNLPRKVSPDEIFTNEFIPRIIPKK